MKYVRLSLEKLNSLTLEEKRAFAESIGYPELLKDWYTGEIDLARFKDIENGVGDGEWTDVYASAVVKLWS